MTSATSDGWVDQLIDSFNAHDFVAVGDFMTADVEYTCWSDSVWTTLRGRESVVALLEGFHQGWSSDFVLRKTFTVVTENGFAVEYAEDGTVDRGPHPSGRRFSLRNVMVGELRDRMISRMTDYSDVIAYRAQTTTTAPPRPSTAAAGLDPPAR
ncbi:MAG: nuclear transport factor 2 family protein [Acidimicrobiales bacterium]